MGIVTRSFEEVVNQYYEMLRLRMIDENILQKAKETVKLLKNEVGHRGIMFTAAVYVAAEELGTPITQRELSIMINCTEVAIRKWIYVLKKKRKEAG